MVRALLPSLLVLAPLAQPAPASAHLRSGTVAVDYRASITDPTTPAYSAQILQSDRALSLTGRPGHVTVLIGYLGEPVLRLDAAGLWMNLASPTAVVLGLVKRSDRIQAAAPRWRLQRGSHSVVWHDARTQGLPPGVSHGSWSVPLIVDGQRSRLEGQLWHFPRPSPWPWLGTLAALVAVGLAPLVLPRSRLAGPAATVFAVIATVASLVLLMAFALDAYASPGTWIEAFDATVFLGVGAWALLRGPLQWRGVGAAGVGLVALAVALLDVPIFLHPIVLAILPAMVTRLAAVLAIAAGVDAAALGGILYSETSGIRW